MRHALAMAGCCRPTTGVGRWLKPVRIRIGIHCGMALAGNIMPGRINYTVNVNG